MRAHAELRMPCALQIRDAAGCKPGLRTQPNGLECGAAPGQSHPRSQSDIPEAPGSLNLTGHETFERMQTLRLGTSSLAASRLAYGCWRSADSWNPAEVTPESQAAGRRGII